jgi:glycosyltransferase involved in cell wall biosynthesis
MADQRGGGGMSMVSKQPFKGMQADSQARPYRVLYFTAVDIGSGDNGGAMVCREHIQRLVGSDRIELTVCSMESAGADRDQRVGEFVGAMGARHHHLTSSPSHDVQLDPRSWCPRLRWPFNWELAAMQRPHIDTGFLRLVRELRPDAVVVDYVLSAIYVTSLFRDPVRRITVTLNREAEFHRRARIRGALPPNVSHSPVVDWRVGRFERWVYNNSQAVVALTPNDLPRGLRRGVKTVVIEPVLDERSERWRFCGANQLFFVGNIAHYPNREAVEWLATRLAPQLERIQPLARIKIIGARPDQVPREWLRANVEYLGAGTKQDVRDCFTTSDIFIAPIVNNFGSKIKVLEALSHGTPVVATRAALTGIPFANMRGPLVGRRPAWKYQQ